MAVISYLESFASAGLQGPGGQSRKCSFQTQVQLWKGFNGLHELVWKGFFFQEFHLLQEFMQGGLCELFQLSTLLVNLLWRDVHP